MTSWPRRRAGRISEPRLYQASGSRHEGADGAQQALGDRELAGVARTAAQAGDQRHRARSIPTWHDGGQRDETLGQQERRAVGFGRVVEADRNTRRLSRAPGRQRVVNHDEAPPHPNLTPDNPAQRRYQAEQPEPFEHPVAGQSGEARIFLIQDDNLTAEVPLRRSILQSTLRQKYRSTGRHNPQRDGGPEK